MRRRAMSRPTPIVITPFLSPHLSMKKCIVPLLTTPQNTGLGHQQSKSEFSLPLVPPLTPTTEKELRKSCSLLILNPPPKSGTQERVQSRLPPPHTITNDRDLPAFPKSATGTGTHTPPPPNSAYGYATAAGVAFATARKLSIGHGGGGSQDIDYNLRASQIEIRRVFNNADSNSIRSSITTSDRTSTFLLAKPTLVDVLPSPRPRTAGTTSSAGWAGSPLTPMKGTGNGHVKSDSSDSNPCDRRLSLFPRPRTAHGGEAPPKSPSPPPLSQKQQDRPLPPLPPSKLKDGGVVEEIRIQVPQQTETTPTPTKKGKKAGFVQFSAFFKATFRFGKRVRSAA
ncbi:hypothetical protein BDD12DRAFT_481515 [Trichophaea hybrida]|nr:hypothetical protein BDD12DRAFT_481515 [Trichophaea hybrida]